MMTSADLIPAAVLKRKAVVYVRQSTQSQVMTNLEGQRRQYDLVEVARQWGFADVEVIDDDLGRSASGMVARPGFERLVAWLCAGKVGAVLCFDASRLARNGRDWHHLLELCGLVEARVIDGEGVYNPCRPNDRLLLGMKGSISEFELGVLRARMLDAARSKARRGELRLSVPFGSIWHREVGLGLDPDLRLQEVIRLIFARFRALGSARQVLLSMKADHIHFPRPSDEGRMTNFEWMPIRYRNVIAVLKNPFYAGVYVYGKSEKRTAIIDGRARKSYGHGKPIGTWEVMIKDHHEGYISWADYDRNQKQLALNNYGRADGAAVIVEGELLLVAIVVRPADVTFMMIFDHHLPCADRLAMAIALARPAIDDRGALLAFPVHIYTGIEWILQNRDDIAVADRHPFEVRHPAFVRRPWEVDMVRLHR